MTEATRTRLALGRSFLVLFAAGLLGILASIPALRTNLEQQLARYPEAAEVLELPAAALMLLLVVQPSVLLAVAVLAGVVMAPRLGLRSHVAERVSRLPAAGPAFRTELPLALAVGAATGALLLVLDLVFSPWMGPAAAALTILQPRTLEITLAGLLYGGITEELLMRWGLLSFLAWVGWRLVQGGAGAPRPGIAWSAILGAALLFGVGHLPFASTMTSLTDMIVLRTVLLNAVAGVAFGWLFWRRSLEAAMAAHAMVHVVFSLVAWLAF